MEGATDELSHAAELRAKAIGEVAIKPWRGEPRTLVLAPASGTYDDYIFWACREHQAVRLGSINCREHCGIANSWKIVPRFKQACIGEIDKAYSLLKEFWPHKDGRLWTRDRDWARWLIENSLGDFQLNDAGVVDQVTLIFLSAEQDWRPREFLPEDSYTF